MDFLDSCPACSGETRSLSRCFVVLLQANPADFHNEGLQTCLNHRLFLILQPYVLRVGYVQAQKQLGLGKIMVWVKITSIKSQSLLSCLQ